MVDVIHVLVVDDDREIRDLLSKYLSQHGLRVTVAADGIEMRRHLADKRIDLVVLDLMLPGEDGITLCRWLQAHRRTPVIMLTAKGQDTDRIIGLESGADDYLPKPFNPRELVARIRAVLRRGAEGTMLPEPTESLAFDHFRIETGRRRLMTESGEIIPLTPGEYDLLLAMAARPGRVLSRDDLLEITRGRTANVFDRSVDVLISRLRRKIEVDPDNPIYVVTVRSGGYMFAPKVRKL